MKIEVSDYQAQSVLLNEYSKHMLYVCNITLSVMASRALHGILKEIHLVLVVYNFE